MALSKSRPCDRRAFQCLRGRGGGHVSSSQPYIISLIVVHIYALVRGIKCSSFIAVKSKAYYFCCLLLKVTTLPSFLFERRHADPLRLFYASRRASKIYIMIPTLLKPYLLNVVIACRLDRISNDFPSILVSQYPCPIGRPCVRRPSSS